MPLGNAWAWPSNRVGGEDTLRAMLLLSERAVEAARALSTPAESEPAEPSLSPSVQGWLRSAGLDVIFMVAPTSPDSRIASIVERSSGFVYCVTVKGVTSAGAPSKSVTSTPSRVRTTT